MNAKNQFKASPGTRLRWTTWATVPLLLGVMVLGFALPGIPVWTRAVMALLPVGLICGCLLFMVRGYAVAPGQLLVQRWLWWTTVDLRGLRSAAADPEAFRRAIKVCGNDGLFSISGWFWSARLRSFRAFATDARHAVVLTFVDRRVVVTPDEPEKFVERVAQVQNLK